MDLRFPWSTPPVDQPWRLWAYGAWNGDPSLTFNEASFAPPEESEVLARFNTARDELPFASLRVFPMLPQFAPSTASTPGSERLIDDVQGDLWAGLGSNTYIGPGMMRPGRMGNTILTSDNRIIPTGRGGQRASNAPGLRQSSGDNQGGSITVPVLGVVFNSGTSDGELEFIDINGDHRPDSVRVDGVQYQVDADHTFTAATPMPFAWGSLRRVHTDTTRAGFSLGSAASVLANDNSGGGRHEATAPSIPSFGISTSTARTEVDLTDINGDGLVDHVYLHDDGAGRYLIDYQLNLGYRLGDVSSMELTSVGPNDHDLSRSAGVHRSVTTSLQFGYAGIGGGPAMTHNEVRSRMLDINGDGLTDRVIKVPTDTFFRVQLNLGDHFDIARPWSVASWPFGVAPSDDALSLSDTFSGNVGAGVPLKVPFVFACLVAELSANINGGRTTTSLDMHDLDGDGRVDHVLRAGNYVYVRRNETGTSNLLRLVTQPLGGSFELTWAREGNRVGVADDGSGTAADMPSQQWVLATVIRHDGAGHTHAHTFDYFHSGFYDRAERENNGYAHVRTTREDGSTLDARYHNQDPFRRGRMWQLVESTSTGVPLKRHALTWAAPSGSPTSFFPALQREETFWYDGASSTPVASTHKDTGYDAWGNVTSVDDVGDVGPDDDVHYTVDYHRDLPRWIFHPNDVAAYHGTTLLRRRTSLYRADGLLSSLTEHVTGGRNPDTGGNYADASANWTWDYDAFGNIWHAADPSGFTLTYGYDPTTSTYRTNITDSFGYSSSSTPDLRFGVPATTTDVNGNVQRLVYDDFGRISEVYAPEDAAGTDPTVRYEYSLASGGSPVFPQWVRVRNKDGAHLGDPLDTVIFVDGFHRTIQTKRDIEVDDGAGGTLVGMSVSGALGFDNRGRAVRVGEGTFDTGLPTSFVGVSEINPTVTVYDTLSRVLSVTAPDGAMTSMAYGAEALDGVTRLTTTVTDPLSRARTSFTNVRGETVAVREHNTIGGTLRTLVTRYGYDPLGRLTQVTDAGGHLTTAGYDSRGLMVSLDNPDTGRAEYRYTLAGDLGATESPRLRGMGQVIRYQRTWHRLDRVESPDSVATVHAYGLPGAPYNQAGRVVETTDASGSRQFRYGRLGEVVWARHEVNAVGMVPAAIGVMEYAYDSFGRMQTLRYPDGVELTYAYDAGANLRRVKAQRGANVWDYVSRVTYDRFGRRASIRYGNGVESRYAYHGVTQRLTGVDSDSASGVALQRLRYNYNAVGNIIWRDNVVPYQPAGALNGTSYQTLFYDDLDQLTTGYGTMYRTDQYRNYTLSIAYDELGNITQKTQDDVLFAAPGWGSMPQSQTSYAWSYAYGGPRPHAPTTVGPRTLNYDGDGNQTGWSDSAAGTSRTLAWDLQDRVQSITTAGSTVQFRYDAGGTRTHKISSAGTTQYLNGFVTVRNGVAATRHVYAGDQRIASTVLPEGMTGSTQLHFYYHTDHLQSAEFVTDGSGAITEHYEYFPFGEPWIDESAGSDRMPYRFVGTELDTETGLNMMGARYYDARQSQWVSPDPIVASYVSGSPAGGVFRPANLGLYTYSWNRPVTLRDPGGTCPMCVAVGIVVLVGATTPTDVPSAADEHLPMSLPEVAVTELGGRAAMAIGGAVLGVAARAVSRWVDREIVPMVESAVRDAFAEYAAEVRRAEVSSAPTVTPPSPRTATMPPPHWEAPRAPGAGRPGDPTSLPDEALVCRGGVCGPSDFARGATPPTSSVTTPLNGVSASSGANQPLTTLSRTYRNRQVGHTTVGDVRRAGGSVVPTPTPENPYHVDVDGLTGQQASILFTPTTRNPNICR